MPIFRNIMAQLRRRSSPDGDVTLRFRTDARTAHYVIPLIEMLLADDEDGETYRYAVAHWHHAERPPLAQYRGTSSLCQIDGPIQAAPAGYPHGWFLPLGGLIETPGATAHLTPFEANAIWRRIEGAIEQVIVGWASEHRLYDNPPAPSGYNRSSADRAAMAMIANWTRDDTRPATAQHPMAGGSDHA